MRIRVSNVLIPASLLLIAGLAASFIMVARRSSPDPVATARVRPDLAFEGLTVAGWGKSGKQWKVTARRAEADADGERFVVSEITGGKLFRGGHPYLEFTAQKAETLGGSQDLVLTGDVIVFRGGRKLLKADELRWNPVSETFACRGGVVIWFDGGTGGTATAAQVLGNVSQGVIVIEGDINVRYRDSTTAKGERAVYHIDDEVLEFEGKTEFELEL